jgi:hypothetical protein
MQLRHDTCRWVCGQRLWSPIVLHGHGSCNWTLFIAAIVSSTGCVTALYERGVDGSKPFELVSSPEFPSSPFSSRITLHAKNH